MLKTFIFVDGSWLSAHLSDISRQVGEDFMVDFGSLPRVLLEGARQALHDRPLLARASYYATIASGVDPQDQSSVDKRRGFLDRLREQYRFDVHAFDVDYGGRRLRRADRDPDDRFTARERFVEIALSVDAMRFASTPGAMDVAVMVVGDAGYARLMEQLRALGVRVLFCAVEGAADKALLERAAFQRIYDGEPLWLIDLLRDHSGRGRGARDVNRSPCPPTGPARHGVIKTVLFDRGYGFIAAEDGVDYFFHASTLDDELDFEELQPEERVVFRVKSEPEAGRAGAAALVSRPSDQD